MMQPKTDRRRFLLLSLTTAAGGLIATDARVSRAIEPITRTSGSHFKFSLAAYSYRDLLQSKPPKLTLDDFIDDCAKFGLDGTELTSYYIPENPTEEYLRQLKTTAFRRGLDISGTAVGNDFCFPPGAKRTREIDHVKRWIEYADLMDAPVIRIFSGGAKPDQTAAEARGLAIEAIEECCDHAGKHGIYLALENHGGLTADADEMLSMVRDVKSPWFGVNMDTGNFRSADVYGDLEKLAPYSLNVQVKVVVHPAGKPSQPSDYNRLAKMLRTSGYRGYIVLEFEELGDPREECKKHIDKLREAFA
jgi:sugar phosphate isomerase/epimerase